MTGAGIGRACLANRGFHLSGTTTLEQAATWAASALCPDVGGYRQECVELMLAARKLADR